MANRAAVIGFVVALAAAFAAASGTLAMLFVDDLGWLDKIAIKRLLWLVVFGLSFVVALEVWGYFYVPTTRRLILSAIAFLAVLATTAAIGPHVLSVVFSVDVEVSAEGAAVRMLLDRWANAGSDSSFVVVSAIFFTCVLIVVYWVDERMDK